MQFDFQPIDLNHRISRRQLLSFSQRFNPKNKNPAQLAVISERTSQNQFLCFGEPINVCDVCLL